MLHFELNFLFPSLPQTVGNHSLPQFFRCIVCCAEDAKSAREYEMCDAASSGKNWSVLELIAQPDNNKAGDVLRILYFHQKFLLLLR